MGIGRRLALLMPLALTACLTFSVTPPSPSHLALELPAEPPAMTISLVDERPADGRIFIVWDSFGNYPEEAELKTDPPRFLAAHVQAELVSRGLPVTIAVGDGGLPRIHLRTFRIRGYREKPFKGDAVEELAGRVLISADLETASGRTRIGVFTAGVDKPQTDFFSTELPAVAVMSEPLGIAVKEFAAKLASRLYDYRSSDATVQEIAGLIAPLHVGSYRNVYALGFTNNPSAIPLLTRIAGAPSLLSPDASGWARDYLERRARDAAVASLGTLRATSLFPFLRGVYENGDLGWRTRCLAAKSIGDLGTKEALDYLDAQLRGAAIEPASKRGGFYAQVIELYL